MKKATSESVEKELQVMLPLTVKVAKIARLLADIKNVLTRKEINKYARYVCSNSEILLEGLNLEKVFSGVEVKNAHNAEISINEIRNIARSSLRHGGIGPKVINDSTIKMRGGRVSHTQNSSKKLLQSF